MVWTLTIDADDPRNVTFGADEPATFTLITDRQGNVILLGYKNPVTDDSEPTLAYDTDGSFWLAPEARVFHHEQAGDDNQSTGFYRTDLEGRGPWATASEAAAAR